MPKEVEPTEELAEKLFRAQLLCMRDHVDSYLLRGGASDDGWDYLQASIELAGLLGEFHREKDLDGLYDLLNAPNAITHDFATDGIATELWDLDCPALPKEVE